MQYNNFVKRAFVAFTLFGALETYAQVSERGADSATAIASAPSAKAIRAENRRLQKAVVQSLSQTKGLSSGNVIVAARNGVVTLAGSVPDAAQVALAVSATRRVDGVKDVKETLDVRPEGK